MTNEKAELNSERVWKELSRALMEPHPRAFFDTLLECDALHVVFPEIYVLKSSLEAYRWHPEGNAYEHTMLVLTAGAKAGLDLEGRLACLVHDFGKGLTPRDKMPKHFGHEITGVPVVENFCNRLSVPAKMKERVMKTTRFHMMGHSLDVLSPKGWVKMFDGLAIKNDAKIVELLYNVFCADERGRLGSEDNDISNLNIFLEKAKLYSDVKFADVFPKGETSQEKIKEGMYRAKINAVK